MLGILRCAWVALVVCLVLATSGSAEAGRKKRLSREARAHLKAGLAHLEKGEHDQAIERLKIAYALSEAPDVLFDIGRAYEGKQDRAQAIYYYTTFIEKAPRGRKRTEAEKRKAALEAEPTAEQPPPDQPDPPVDPPKDPPPPVDDDPPPVDRLPPDPDPAPAVGVDRPSRGGGGLRLVGWISLAAGVALGGAGGYFAWVASDRSSQLSAIFDEGRPWEPRYDQLYDEGRAAQRNSRILLAAGGAAVLTGGVLLLLGRNRGGGSVDVAATGGGAAVSWTCAW